VTEAGCASRSIPAKIFGEEAMLKCYRCNGIMSNEKFYGPGEPFGGRRGVLCGEIFDMLIWENRYHCKKLAMVGKRAIPGGKGRR